jgi:hypothetical protein
MLPALRNATSSRKARLFAVACCRNSWNSFTDEELFKPGKECDRAILLGEHLADGLTDEEDRAAIEKTMLDAYERSDDEFVESLFSLLATLVSEDYSLDDAFSCAFKIAEFASCSGDLSFHGLEAEILAEHADLLRDIFGNPFHPVTLDPRWLTASVLDLARIIYDERAFERMPILADALMDAGCDNDDILNHCRGDSPHVRGCWVVDLLLGKE